MLGYGESNAEIYTCGDEPVSGENNPALIMSAQENVPRLSTFCCPKLSLPVRAKMPVFSDVALGTGLVERTAPPAVSSAARKVPLGAAPQPFFSSSRTT